MIKIDHVTKKYEEFTAVRDLSLTVSKAEFLVLLGPSIRLYRLWGPSDHAVSDSDPSHRPDPGSVKK